MSDSGGIGGTRGRGAHTEKWTPETFVTSALDF